MNSKYITDEGYLKPYPLAVLSKIVKLSITMTTTGVDNILITGRLTPDPDSTYIEAEYVYINGNTMEMIR